jgi:hypothetical protein
MISELPWNEELRQRMKQRYGTAANFSEAIDSNLSSVKDWCRGAVVPRHSTRAKIFAALGEFYIPPYPADARSVAIDASIGKLSIRQNWRAGRGRGRTYSQGEIASAIGVTSERVRQIEDAALEKIRGPLSNLLSTHTKDEIAQAMSRFHVLAGRKVKRTALTNEVRE